MIYFFVFAYLYSIAGFCWMVYALWRNSQAPKATQENWFPVVFFSYWLWWLFLWIAYDKGIVQEDFRRFYRRI